MAKPPTTVYLDPDAIPRGQTGVVADSPEQAADIIRGNVPAPAPVPSTAPSAARPPARAIRETLPSGKVVNVDRRTVKAYQQGKLIGADPEIIKAIEQYHARGRPAPAPLFAPPVAAPPEEKVPLPTRYDARRDAVSVDLPEGAKQTPGGTIWLPGIGDTGITPKGAIQDVSRASRHGTLEAVSKFGVRVSGAGLERINAERRAETQKTGIGGSIAFIDPSSLPGGEQNREYIAAVEAWEKTKAEAERAYDEAEAGLQEGQQITETRDEFLERIQESFTEGTAIIFKPDVRSEIEAQRAIAAARGADAARRALGKDISITDGLVTVAGKGIEDAVSRIGQEETARHLAALGFDNADDLVLQAQNRIAIRAKYAGFIQGSQLDLSGIASAFRDQSPSAIDAELQQIGFMDVGTKLQAEWRRADALADYAAADGYDVVRLLDDLKGQGNTQDEAAQRVIDLGFDPSDAISAAKWAYSSPEERFRQMQEDKDIPKYAIFAGVDDEGQVTYFEPTFDENDVPGLKAKESKFLKDGWEMQLKALAEAGLEPSLTATVEETDPAKIVQRRGPEGPIDFVITRPDDFKAYWENLSEAERLTTLAVYNTPDQRVKNVGTFLLELTPYGTVKHWNDFSLTEKIIYAGMDALIIVSLAGPKIGVNVARVVGRGARISTARTVGIGKQVFALTYKPKNVQVVAAGIKGRTGKNIIQVAQRAGRAHNAMLRYQLELKQLLILEKKGVKVTPSKLLKAQTNIQKAANESMAADAKFRDMFIGLKEIDEATLVRMERVSRMRGLQVAVNNVNKAQGKLIKAWKSLEDDITRGKLKIGTDAYLQRLNKIEVLKTNLDKSLVKLSERIRPRVTETPVEEFKGYQMSWDKPIKPTSPTAGNIRKTSKRIDDVVAESRAKAKVTAVAVRAKQEELFTLKLARKFEKPVEKKLTAVKKAPKVETETRAAKAAALAKAIEKARKEAMPVKRLDRKPLPASDVEDDLRTQQITRLLREYQTKVAFEVTPEIAQKITTEFQQAVDVSVESALRAYTEALAQNLTEAEAISKADIAAGVATEEALKTESRVLVKTLLKTKVMETTKDIVKIRIKTRARLRVPLIPIWFQEKETKTAEEEEFPAGTITWRQGELHGKDEWKILRPPYIEVERMDHAPRGAKNVEEEGEGSAFRTVQVIGGSPPEDVDIDLGWADIHIDTSGLEPVISFKADGEFTDVGKSKGSPTKGVSVDVTEEPRPPARERVRTLAQETQNSVPLRAKEGKLDFTGGMRRREKPRIAQVSGRTYRGRELPDRYLGSSF